MSLPASDRVYSLQMSESWTLFHFWFGFIREAFNSLVCVAFSLCFTHLLITIAVTVGFWCLFCICHAICDFSEAHSLVSFDTNSASCSGCNFSLDIEVKMIEINSLLELDTNFASCSMCSFRYWNQNNWNQFFIKIWAFAWKLVFCDKSTVL